MGLLDVVSDPRFQAADLDKQMEILGKVGASDDFITQYRIKKHNLAAQKAGTPPAPAPHEFMPGYSRMADFLTGAAKEVPSAISGMIPETFKHPVDSAKAIAGGVVPYFQQHPEEIALGGLGPLSRSMAEQSVASYQRAKDRGMPTISALAAGVPLVGPPVEQAGERVAASRNPQELAQALGRGAVDVAPLLTLPSALRKGAGKLEVPAAETTFDELGMFEPPPPPASTGVKIPPTVERAALAVRGVKGMALRAALRAAKTFGRETPGALTQGDLLKAVKGAGEAEGGFLENPAPGVVGEKMLPPGRLPYKEALKIHKEAQAAGEGVDKALADYLKEQMTLPQPGVPLGPQGELTTVTRGISKPPQGWVENPSPGTVADLMQPPTPSELGKLVDDLKAAGFTQERAVETAQNMMRQSLTPKSAPAATMPSAGLKPTPMSSSLPSVGVQAPAPPPPPAAAPEPPPSPTALASAAGEAPTAPAGNPMDLVKQQLKEQLAKGDPADLKALDDMIERSNGKFREVLRQIRQQHVATMGVRKGDFHIVGGGEE